MAIEGKRDERKGREEGVATREWKKKGKEGG
jgi:hypothetical protein